MPRVATVKQTKLKRAHTNAKGHASKPVRRHSIPEAVQPVTHSQLPTSSRGRARRATEKGDYQVQQENVALVQQAARARQEQRTEELKEQKRRKAEELARREVNGHRGPFGETAQDEDTLMNPIDANAFTTKAVIKPLNRKPLVMRSGNIPPIPSLQPEASRGPSPAAPRSPSQGLSENHKAASQANYHRSTSHEDVEMEDVDGSVDGRDPDDSVYHEEEIQTSEDGDREDDADYEDDASILSSEDVRRVSVGAQGDTDDEEGEAADGAASDVSQSADRRQRQVRPRLSDYHGLDRNLILDAIGHYRCQIVTSRPFPSTTRCEPMKLAKGAWAAACQTYETERAWDGNVVKLITARGSHVRGELKTKARSLVKSMYGFSNGKNQKAIARNRKRAEELLDDYNYLYRRRTSEGRKGFCQHKIIQEIVNEMWFRDGDDEGIKYDRYFGRASYNLMALIFTVLECCIEEWGTGVRREIDFTTQKYKPIFKRILEMLLDFREKGGEEFLDAVRTSLVENGRAHSGAMAEEQDRRGPMSADAIAAAIQDFKEHGGLYNESSDEELEDADD